MSDTEGFSSSASSGADGLDRMELEKLPPWAMAGLALRAVLRALPELLEEEIAEWSQAPRQLQALEVHYLAAMLAARRGEPMDREPARESLKQIGEARERSRLARLVLASTSALAGVEPDTIDNVHQLLSEVTIVDETIGALGQDYEFLQSEPLPPSQSQDQRIAFFGQQLWPHQQPVLWDLGSSDAKQAIERAAPGLPDRYAAIHRGDGVPWVEFERHVRNWLEDQPVRAELRAIDDAPLQSDAGDELGYGVYADALAGLISSTKTATPLTIAINAPWGAGKTSLANLIRRRLERAERDDPQKRCVVCWFNAWMHDDAPNLASAFAAEVAQTANDHRSAWCKYVSPMPGSLMSHARRRKRRLNRVIAVLVLAAIGVMAFQMLASESTLERLGWISTVAEKASGLEPGTTELPLGFGALVVLLGLLHWGLGLIRPVADSLARFVRDPEEAASSGSMMHVSEQLGRLIGEALQGSGRFVIFIDDLERCTPPRAADVLEINNQLLGHENVVTVILADMPAVTACAQLKYKQLADIYEPGGGLAATGPHGLLGYGRAYVKKIIQLTFDLPLPQRVRQPTTSDEDVKTATVGRLVSEVARLHRTSPSATALTRRGRRSRKRRWLRRIAARLCRRASRSTAEMVRGAWRDSSIQERAGLVMFSSWAYPGLMMAELVGNWLNGNRRRRKLSGLPRMLEEASAITIVLAWAAGILMVCALIPPWRLIGFRLAFAAWSVSSVLSGVLIGIAQREQRRRDRIAAREQDARINETVDQQRRTGTLDEAAVVRELQKLKRFEHENPKKLKQRVQQALVDDSEVIDEALRETLEFLPPLPRSIKRLTNRLRLLIHIAQLRNMLRVDRQATARRIGKWVALGERWPELAQVLAANPSLMPKLEKEAVVSERFAAWLASCLGNETAEKYAQDSELSAFFRTGTPLGDRLTELLSFAAT